MRAAISRHELATIVTSIFLSMFALGECLQTTGLYDKHAEAEVNTIDSDATSEGLNLSAMYSRGGGRPII